MKGHSIYEFIRRNRSEIDGFIRSLCSNIGKLNDEDRRGWILNDERLYLWARREGVRIAALFVLSLSFFALGAHADKPKNLYKIMHISQSQVGVVCQNGADPTGVKMGELLVISCGH